MEPHKKLEHLKIGYLMGDQGLREGGPTLVMIHGAGGRAQVWKNQIVLLDKTINVLALDLPGHGNTEGDGRSHISEYAQWLVEIIKAIFDHPIFLMGHSMGGAIAQEAAITSPHILEGIVLVGTGARLKVAPMFLDGLSNNFEEILETLISYAYGSGTDKSIIEEGLRMMKASGSRIVYNDFLACDGFDSRQTLAQIHLPCLVLCGSEDKLAPPKLSEALKEGIEGSVLKFVPNAGHTVMIERYKEVNQAVQEFILGVHS
ncbi:MAG: alpha/beta hydrolase [Desulfobacteraceae bacterium]|jgi:pimeloyl-ACP methyl ester carboxylesterase